VEIIETSVFTRQVLRLLTDDEYRKLQAVLASRPTVGDLIRGSGGLRKHRWGIGDKGKRGGIRVIYYWAPALDQLLMLFMYPKTERDDLSDEQVRVLRAIVREEYP
jgi:hypothetical protein